MKYFNVKVKFTTEEIKANGEAKTRLSEYVVQDEIADGAIVRLREYLVGTVLEYEIIKVIETKIEAVLKV